MPSQYPTVLAANQTVRDRRSKVRFPLDLSVHFRPLSGDPFSGAGRAVNVSSGGVLVVSKQDVWQHGIRVGAWIEFKIEWPSMLEGKIPLQLFAVGRVVRYRKSDFAAAFERYQFRTVRRSRLPHARLGEGVIQWPV